MPLRGVSTRKIKVVSKVHWEREYSAATVSEFNKTLKEEWLKWMNRKIEAPIKYLFPGGVKLKVTGHWIFREALLTANIRADGDEEFLGFILGGKKSSGSLRRFSASPYPRRA